MKRQSSNRSGLLLMEIIIAILFFSVVSAVCLQLFVKSHNLSRDSKELSCAVNQVNSVAEIIQSSDYSINNLKNYYENLNNDNGNYYVSLDANFFPIKDSADTLYELAVTPVEESDTLFSYHIELSKRKPHNKKDRIYDLNVTTYKPVSSHTNP